MIYLNMKICLNILWLLIIFNITCDTSKIFADEKKHPKYIILKYASLAPNTHLKKLIIVQKVLNRITEAYPNIEQIFLTKFEWHASTWFDEFQDLYYNKRLSEDEMIVIIDILIRLTSSSFFSSKPSLNYDTNILRTFSSIYGGSYDYRKVKSSKDKGITIYNGLSPWIISESENPVFFLKTFIQLIIFEIKNSSTNLIKIYHYFDKLENRFDILLSIIENIKEEPDYEKKEIFQEIWKDIHKQKFHILNESWIQKTFMRYIGTRILDKIMSST